MRLLIFPHAGGSPSFYKHWGDLVPDNCEVWIAAYPGKEARFNEAYAVSIQQMASQAIESYKYLNRGPDLVLFGHSMGAVVAYEFLRVLRQLCLPTPLLFCVSGRSYLVSYSNKTYGYLSLCNKDFLKTLNDDYGGIPEAVFESFELIDLIADNLRSDINLTQKYKPVSVDVLDCDILHLSGINDSTCLSGLHPWWQLTSKAYIEQFYEGGHFFIRENATRIISDIFASAHSSKQSPSE